MHFLAQFFAGAFLVNSIPHITSGLLGMPFPTPFAKPPGKGSSSPSVNFLWGSLNLLLGLVLLHQAPFRFGLNVPCAVFFAGFFILGVLLAINFGRVRAGKS